ncbi:hypothetical protein ABQE69_05365 [Mycolicibacillus trivialis]
MTVISQQLTDDVPPMAEADARKLDMRIRNLGEDVARQLGNVLTLVAEAKRGNIHEALGFPSWTAYIADAAPKLTGMLGDRENRRDMVELLHGEGMSQRAIAALLDVSQPTVRRDLGQVSRDDSPDPDAVDPPPAPFDVPQPTPTTGVDGKTYPRKPKTPKKPPPGDNERRRRYREDMTRKAFAAADAVEKLSRHASGDQFSDYVGRPTEAARNVRKRLQRSVDYLQELLARLPETPHADNPD